MKKILMVLDNAFSPDLRVLKEINTLVSLGCKIDLYCWDQDSNLKEFESRNGYNIYRIKVRALKQVGIKKIFYLTKFYYKFYQQFKKNASNYDIIYVHDFLLLALGVILKRRFKLNLIYDAHEIYHIMEWEKYPSLVRKLIFFTEKFLIKFTDHFIVVSNYRKEFYGSFINKEINVVGNWYDEYDGQSINLREKYSIPGDKIILGYFGVINFKARPIDKIIEKLKNNDNIYLFIGGMGVDNEKITSLIKDSKNIFHLGWLENVRDYVNSLDYVIYVMNNERKYSAYTAPNTLYLAISHLKPIITNVVGEPKDLIDNYGVGHFIKNINDFEVKHLIEYNNSREEIIKNISKIRQNYLWSESIKTYKKILKIY